MLTVRFKFLRITETDLNLIVFSIFQEFLNFNAVDSKINFNGFSFNFDFLTKTILDFENAKRKFQV